MIQNQNVKIDKSLQNGQINIVIQNKNEDQNSNDLKDRAKTFLDEFRFINNSKNDENFDN